MSSMFKKKGSLAFKPKIPSARPRSTAPVTNVSVAKSVLSEPVTERDAKRAPSNAPSTTAHASEPTDGSLDDADIAELNSAVEPESTSRHATDSTQQQETDTATRIPSNEATSLAEGPAIIEDIAATEQQTQGESYDIQPQKIVASIAQHNIAPELRDPPHAIIDSLDSVQALPSNEDASESRPVVEESIQAPTPPPSSTAPKTRSRSKAQTAASENTEAGGDTEARPRKRQRTSTSDGDGPAGSKLRQRKASTQDGATTPRTRARRARSATPDDAQDQLVDLQKLKMTDLTKDLHIGKKFSRHDELRERERQARIKAKLKKNGENASREGSEAPESNSGEQSAKSKSATPTATTPAAPAPASGPQFRIVDGQIIVDQSSLVMDRHARATAARGDMETVEENDFTRLITSSSFMNTSKLRGPNIWTDEETELFYRALGMFGTEFEMIAKMFPNKQRRHVKLKFNREERHCPQRINAALIGEKTIKLDIDEYKALTGVEFESVESIEAEQRKIQETFEAEQQRIADEQAEIMRKKREELFADEDGDGGNEDGTGKKKKKGKKRGKQTVQYGLSGEPITAEES